MDEGNNILVVGERCTGCEVCKDVCQSGAISFEKNYDGFYYPIIDKKCTLCGGCLRKCPAISFPKLFSCNLPEYCYVGSNDNKQILVNSSSGGAFSAIVNAFKPDRVYGVKWEAVNKAVHVGVDVEEYYSLRKSKYVQAHINNSYVETKRDLKNGNRVIFSGTPCQIGALRNYLGKEYDNLLAVEIICHGVGSPGLFENYIKYLEKKNKCNLEKYDFRRKNSRGGWGDFVTTTMTTKGKKKESKYDTYCRLFLERKILRKSCGKCVFSRNEHLSDIIIGDYWGCEKHNPELYNPLGVSVVIPLSNKGKQTIGRISEMELKLISTDIILMHNSSLKYSRDENSDRENLFEFYRKHGDEVFEKYKPIKTIKKYLGVLLIPAYTRIVVIIGKLKKRNEN